MMALLHGQVVTNSGISGTVKDQSSAVIPYSLVTATNQGTGATWTATANSSGVYAFLSLLPGTYTVTATHPGFKMAVVANRAIIAGQPALVDFVLQVGATTERVTVTAEGAEMLATTSTEIAATISPKLVQDIPLISRNMFDLTLLAPGVVPQDFGGGDPVTFAGCCGANMVALMTGIQAANVFHSSGVMVGGNRDTSTNVSVDGSNVQHSQYQAVFQLQSPADIEQVKIEAANMSAEFGSGAAAINVITKSGTNRIHGQAFEFIRNNVLDANNFFSNLYGDKLPRYQQNQFGGALGGPIIKDKLMFFTNYEGLRTRQGVFGIFRVPSDALRNGDFGPASATNPTIYNPWRFDPKTGLREPFPGNKIPIGPTSLCAPNPTCIDPTIVKFLDKYTPHANGSYLGGAALIGDYRAIYDSDQYTVRIDWHKSANTNIYARYTNFETHSYADSLMPLQGIRAPYSSKNPVLHYTQIVQAAMVNDLMVSYTRPIWTNGPAHDIGDVPAAIGLKNAGLLNIPMSGLEVGARTRFVTNATQDTYQLKDDLSYVRGTHSLKFGVEGTERRLYHTRSGFGTAFFNAIIFSAACPEGNKACDAARTAAGFDGGGSVFADFLLGTPAQAGNSFFPANFTGYQLYRSAYIQDAWRIHPRLMINAGLRYEFWPAWGQPRNTTGFYDPTSGTLNYRLQNPLDYLDPQKCYGACAPVNSKVPEHGYITSNKNFAPRLGLAYNVSSNTVIRAAGGVFFDGNVNNNQLDDISSGMAPFRPQSNQIVDRAQQVPTLLFKDLFPAIPPTTPVLPNQTPPATFRAPQHVYKTAAIYQWSATVQRRLGAHFQLEVNYLGSHTIRQFMYLDMNAPDQPLGALAKLTLQQRRPFPQFAEVGTWAPIGWARYRALIISAKNVEWHGLTWMGNITMARNIASSHVLASDYGNTNFRLPYIWAGRSALTPPYRFVTGFSYDLPVGRGKIFGTGMNQVLNGVFGGWKAAGIVTLSKGSPDGVTASDNSGTGAYYQHADLVPGCDPNIVPGGRNREHWFNADCFVQPQYGTYGNTPWGIIVNPGQNNWNVNLAKSWKTNFPNESSAIELRWESFNTFNHTQWGPAYNYIEPGYTGTISSARPGRQIQFGLTYNF
jgi:hypothetical protein